MISPVSGVSWLRGIVPLSFVVVLLAAGCGGGGGGDEDAPADPPAPPPATPGPAPSLPNMPAPVPVPTAPAPTQPPPGQPPPVDIPAPPPVPAAPQQLDASPPPGGSPPSSALVSVGPFSQKDCFAGGMAVAPHRADSSTGIVYWLPVYHFWDANGVYWGAQLGHWTYYRHRTDVTDINQLDWRFMDGSGPAFRQWVSGWVSGGQIWVVHYYVDAQHSVWQGGGGCYT